MPTNSLCLLIHLDKSPGVRPTAVGEVLQRIIEKAIMRNSKPDILNVTGSQH